MFQQFSVGGEARRRRASCGRHSWSASYRRAHAAVAPDLERRRRREAKAIERWARGDCRFKQEGVGRKFTRDEGLFRTEAFTHSSTRLCAIDFNPMVQIRFFYFCNGRTDSILVAPLSIS